jgi:NAD(P)-dependent dehydrogenase (short-subunit alcohol dehydrogenase family)
MLAPLVRANLISSFGSDHVQPAVFDPRHAARTPFGRMPTDGDFRGVISFLATDLPEFIAGQNILVDGGLGVL